MDEVERQGTTDASRALDFQNAPALTDLVRQASTLFGTPMAALSVVTGDRQVFLATQGLAVRETARSASFCAHAILSPDQPFCVPDAAEDKRFAGNPLVLGSPTIRFYAGACVRMGNGRPIGALCVMDNRPLGRIGPEGLVMLERLAAKASDVLQFLSDGAGVRPQ